MKTQINEDIKAAMKAKDTLKLATLRLLKAAIINQEIGLGYELAATDIIGTIRKQIKQRQETIAAVGRTDMQEHAEIKILEAYLPAGLSEQELTDIVVAAIQEAAVTSKKQMGAVMKIVTPKVAGRADGKTVSTLVNSLLA